MLKMNINNAQLLQHSQDNRIKKWHKYIEIQHICVCVFTYTYMNIWEYTYSYTCVYEIYTQNF